MIQRYFGHGTVGRSDTLMRYAVLRRPIVVPIIVVSFVLGGVLAMSTNSLPMSRLLARLLAESSKGMA